MNFLFSLAVPFLQLWLWTSLGACTTLSSHHAAQASTSKDPITITVVQISTTVIVPATYVNGITPIGLSFSTGNFFTTLGKKTSYHTTYTTTDFSGSIITFTEAVTTALATLVANPNAQVVTVTSTSSAQSIASTAPEESLTLPVVVPSTTAIYYSVWETVETVVISTGGSEVTTLSTSLFTSFLGSGPQTSVSVPNPEVSSGDSTSELPIPTTFSTSYTPTSSSSEISPSADPSATPKATASNTTVSKKTVVIATVIPICCGLAIFILCVFIQRKASRLPPEEKKPPPPLQFNPRQSVKHVSIPLGSPPLNPFEPETEIVYQRKFNWQKPKPIATRIVVPINFAALPEREWAWNRSDVLAARDALDAKSKQEGVQRYGNDEAPDPSYARRILPGARGDQRYDEKDEDETGNIRSQHPREGDEHAHSPQPPSLVRTSLTASIPQVYTPTGPPQALQSHESGVSIPKSNNTHWSDLMHGALHRSEYLPVPPQTAPAPHPRYAGSSHNSLPRRHSSWQPLGRHSLRQSSATLRNIDELAEVSSIDTEQFNAAVERYEQYKERGISPTTDMMLGRTAESVAELDESGIIGTTTTGPFVSARVAELERKMSGKRRDAEGDEDVQRSLSERKRDEELTMRIRSQREWNERARPRIRRPDVEGDLRVPGALKRNKSEESVSTLGRSRGNAPRTSRAREGAPWYLDMRVPGSTRTSVHTDADNPFQDPPPSQFAEQNRSNVPRKPAYDPANFSLQVPSISRARSPYPEPNTHINPLRSHNREPSMRPPSFCDPDIQYHVAPLQINRPNLNRRSRSVSDLQDSGWYSQWDITQSSDQHPEQRTSVFERRQYALEHLGSEISGFSAGRGVLREVDARTPRVRMRHDNSLHAMVEDDGNASAWDGSGYTPSIYSQSEGGTRN